MTQVLFAFKHPSGEPLVGATFTVRLQRSGFVFESDGVVVPETLTFVTGPEGTVLAELEPSSTPYLMVVQETGDEDDDDCCTGSSAIRYKFYVPESDTIVRAQDLLLAPVPNSEPWDETAIQMLTDAKIAAMDAAIRAKASEVSALDSAERAEAAAGGIEEDATRAERARDAAQSYANDSFNWSTKSAEYQVIASAAAVQTTNDAAQVAEAFAYIYPAYEDFKLKYPEIVQAAIDSIASAAAAKASEISADESELSAIDARDAAEAYSITALAARIETDEDRIAAQLAATQAGDAAQVRVDDFKAQLALPTGAEEIGYKRSKIGAAIEAANDMLDTVPFNPWEHVAAVTNKPDPADADTWDWQPALQKAIDELWVYAQAGLLFNGAKSSGMQTLSLIGRTYGIGTGLKLPTGNGTGGAGGMFRITGGGLKAIGAYPPAVPMLRASSTNTNDWTQGVYIDHLEFDGARLAQNCIEVQKSAGTYISYCHITRYTRRGVYTAASAFNVTVVYCYIEAFPYINDSVQQKAERAMAPEAGIYFNSPDCVAAYNVVIGNEMGIRTSSRCRVNANHIYGNKYGMQVNTQYVIATGNYFEDPVIATNGFADSILTGNLFSNSARGGCVILPDDGLAQLRGANIAGNSRSIPVLTALGDITLSGVTGDVTITSTLDTFDDFVETGAVPDGGIITAAGAYAVIYADPSNTTKQVKARVVGTFTAAAYAASTWTHLPCFIALIETTFGTTSALSVAASSNIQHYPTAVHADPTIRLYINNGGPLTIPGRGLYDWSRGDGRGDFSIGTATANLSFGVLTASANAGSAAIWSTGSLEQIQLGGKVGGQFVFATVGSFGPGRNNAIDLGSVTRLWAVVRAGTGTISTSDARHKTMVWTLRQAELEAGAELGEEIGGYRFLQSVAEKGDAARIHIGMTVQRAIEVMESHGLVPWDYSFICHDVWDAKPAVIDTEGNVIDLAVDAGDMYSFREVGLYAFIVAGFIAKTNNRLAALEAK